MRYGLLLASLLLMSCGGADNAEDEDRETVFDPMVETIDRAKEVEDTVLKHKEEMDKRLREMEEASGEQE